MYTAAKVKGVYQRFADTPPDTPLDTQGLMLEF